MTSYSTLIETSLCVYLYRFRVIHCVSKNDTL